MFINIDTLQKKKRTLVEWFGDIDKVRKMQDSFFQCNTISRSFKRALSWCQARVNNFRNEVKKKRKLKILNTLLCKILNVSASMYDAHKRTPIHNRYK